VVCAEGTSIQEDDIAKFVAERVPPAKRLSGGVKFVSKLPVSEVSPLLSSPDEISLLTCGPCRQEKFSGESYANGPSKSSATPTEITMPSPLRTSMISVGMTVCFAPHRGRRALMGIPRDPQLANAGGLAVDIVGAWLQRNAPGAAAIPTRSREKTLPVFV
jgi:hypothetical protein